MKAKNKRWEIRNESGRREQEDQDWDQAQKIDMKQKTRNKEYRQRIRDWEQGMEIGRSRIGNKKQRWETLTENKLK